MHDKLFITGCDNNTEWMLPWFIKNFKKHSKIPLVVFDFGMTDAMAKEIKAIKIKSQDKGWFKKPKAMLEATKKSKMVCWLDTDCHIQGSIDEIFNYVEPQKLTMGVDEPWTTRQGEKWHNSGVVAFQGRPSVLDAWAAEVARNPQRGDQEVLHTMVRDGMRRIIHINDLPKKYNTLRLDVLDGTTPKDIHIMHWTGIKGKDEIRRLMNV